MEAVARIAVKTLPLILALLLLPGTARASIPPEVEDTLPPEAREVLEDLDEEEFFSLRKGLDTLGEKAKELLPGLFRNGLRRSVSIMGIAILCGMARSVVSNGGMQVDRCITAAGILAVTVLSTKELESVMGLGAQMLEELDVFSKALLPTLAAAVAAGGGIISAGVRQTAMIFFSNLLISFVSGVLLPLIYYYIAITAMSALLPEQKLAGLAGGMKKAIIYGLTGGLLLFTGYLTVTGAAATSADAMTLQLTKSAISTAVPVVGGIISNAAGSVLQSAGLLKNALGVTGMLAVLAISLAPFFTLAVQYLLYKAVGFFSGLMGDEIIAGYVTELGGAFGLLLGMTGCCALLLLICVASCVSVVVT